MSNLASSVGCSGRVPEHDALGPRIMLGCVRFQSDERRDRARIGSGFPSVRVLRFMTMRLDTPRKARIDSTGAFAPAPSRPEERLDR